jgi:hypothetical protein
MPNLVLSCPDLLVSMVMTMQDASHLSDAALTTELSRLASREREATAALIVHLAEFDSRRLYEGAGFPSLFQYCMKVLRLSEDAVYNRITAARAARRHPAIVDMLVSGALTPTTVRLLARHLTAENGGELLPAAAGKGKQEVEELLAWRFPQADVPPRVRRLPGRPAPTASSAMTASSTAATTAAMPVSNGPMSVGGGGALPPSPNDTSGKPAPAFAGPRPIVRPLAPERYEVRFTATAETREKLRRAQDLLGHAIPSGDIAQVVDRALTLLVADLERRKFAATRHPGRSPGQSKDSRNIPAEVQRCVTTRDGGRCRFVAKSGRRCDERRFLEFHHVIPYGAGGEPTVENIELRCRAHNGYEAERFYGPAMRRTRGNGVRGRAADERAVLCGSVAEGATRSGTSRVSDGGGRMGHDGGRETSGWTREPESAIAHVCAHPSPRSTTPAIP